MKQENKSDSKLSAEKSSEGKKRKLSPIFEKQRPKKKSKIEKKNHVPNSQMKPLFVGSHVSMNGGFYLAAQNAVSLGANCFAMFTGSQKSWPKKDEIKLEPSVIQRFQEECEAAHIDRKKHIVPHASYLLNMGSPDDTKLLKSRNLMHIEVSKCQQLGIGLYNFHPGSHLKLISEEECCKRIAESVNLEHKRSEGLILLLENTAGQGTNIGYKFEHLRDIINHVEDKSRVGVCFDTCHAFAAGYDLRTEKACDKTFSKFEEIVGFQYLKAVHLNDSQGKLGCRKDRHENIGKGEIGIECFKYLVNDPRFRDIPMVLETPNGIASQEIKKLKSLVIHNSSKDEKEEQE